MKKRINYETIDLRLDPTARLCPRFDEMSIAMYPLPEPDEMGFRVVDNCAEENIR